jgi:hypothetical protein
MSKCIQIRTTDSKDKLSSFVHSRELVVRQRIAEFYKVADECEAAFNHYMKFYVLEDKFNAENSTKAFNELYQILVALVSEQER